MLSWFPNQTDFYEFVAHRRVYIWYAMIFLLTPFNICHFNQMHLYADRFYL